MGIITERVATSLGGHLNQQSSGLLLFWALQGAQSSKTKEN